jgi:hypothetical protein
MRVFPNPSAVPSMRCLRDLVDPLRAAMFEDDLRNLSASMIWDAHAHVATMCDAPHVQYYHTEIILLPAQTAVLGGNPMTDTPRYSYFEAVGLPASPPQCGSEPQGSRYPVDPAPPVTDSTSKVIRSALHRCCNQRVICWTVRDRGEALAPCCGTPQVMRIIDAGACSRTARDPRIRCIGDFRTAIRLNFPNCCCAANLCGSGWRR